MNKINRVICLTTLIVLGWSVVDGIKVDKRRALECDRLTPIVQQVKQKAIGDDNYFSSKEQKDFLRAIGYEGVITEGQVVDFGVAREPYEPLPKPYVSIDYQNHYIPEKDLRRFLGEV